MTLLVTRVTDFFVWRHKRDLPYPHWIYWIVDGYVPAKDIIPKNPYRVFLRYRLVKYRENTDRCRTEILNRNANMFGFGSGDAAR